MKRRKFLKSGGLAAGALSLPSGLLASSNKAAAQSLADGASGPENIHTLFFQPSLIREKSLRYASWCHSITEKNGRLYNGVGVQQFGEDFSRLSPLGLSVAESDDGVHWRETNEFACPVEHGRAGYCIRWTGKEFVYYLTEFNTGSDGRDYPLVVRQYSSKDFHTWEFMGDRFTTRPEKKWYRVRWDELVILEDNGNYYGYITSEPKPEFALDTLGMLKSEDGVKWEVITPPQFKWDGLPRQHMEVCFCTKIDGLYYLGMGSRAYMGHLGFSVLVFVSDSPTGPFTPDKSALRLCGNTSRDTNWLGKTFHFRGELLFSNWITTSLDRSYNGIFGNGKSLWIGPLKKVIVDQDKHLKLAWWPENNMAKDSQLQIDLKKSEFVHPVPEFRMKQSEIDYPTDDVVSMKASHDGVLSMLPGKMDFSQGIIIEGAFRATEPHGRVSTHWHPAAAGFYFEETAGKGMLIQMETLGLTRIGVFEYSPEPVFDAFEYEVASWGNTNRGGSYVGLSRFTQEDVIGPIGYAPPCGIINDTFHDFKLLVKQGMFEYYQDDLLVQTYITGPTSGRFALFAKSGLIEFRNLKVYSLTPDSLS